MQLNKWRNDYNVVLLWIEKAEEKQSQHDDDGGDDLDKLKKQRKRLEVSNVDYIFKPFCQIVCFSCEIVLCV